MFARCSGLIASNTSVKTRVAGGGRGTAVLGLVVARRFLGAVAFFRRGAMVEEGWFEKVAKLLFLEINGRVARRKAGD